MKLNKIVFVLSVVLFSAACATKSPVIPETATKCEQPRPQMCTRDYRPTCAFKSDGSTYVASNPCEACANEDVVYFEAGECQ